MFTDRTEAGRLLAAQLEHLRGERPVVLGLPRGGVPVAYEVARALGAPLDVILVRKLGVPTHRELGFGAIGEDGVRIVHEHIVRMGRVDPASLAAVERTEEAELRRQADRFRRGRPRVELTGRAAVVVDDGVATGATASVACRVAKEHGARRVVLAVPVAPPDAAAGLRAEVDELVCLSTPAAFFAVGEWYEDFSQTSDGEVVELLAQHTEATRSQGGPGNPGSSGHPGNPGNPGDNPGNPGDRIGNPAPGPVVREVEIPVPSDGVHLTGDLHLPSGAPGVVAFAHGSGSSRRSPRNRAVAAALNRAGLGTLLFDLLTPAEELDRANVFDVQTLARRLAEATRLLRRQHRLPVAYFGASTGAAAALWAASERDPEGRPGVAAVVSRGGRPDLAGDRLRDVRAPTLLIVGGADETVVDLNRQAQSRLRCENRLEVVPGATHLFEEPGALDAVCDLARDWFLGHLGAHSGK
ncbi:phosphoribosyltransferase family protein [Streptomyces pathocidini]|uniref:Phosphoribosyltransferase family protein n=1 Tax=Streptomyces pathocidini TaxID=1650571 RepID=A0ABW7UPA4_9ACTN